MNARFAPGDRVRMRALHPGGHTRLPGYLAGRSGEILRISGYFPVADERALGLRDARIEAVYAVRFAFAEHEVVADLWERYMEAEA